MRVVSCLCHIAQSVGGEIEAVNQTFKEILRGNLFRSLSDRASLPYFRIFAMFVGHPCGNCLSDEHMEISGKMTAHLRLQDKIFFARAKPLALEEFVHEF